MKFASIGSGSAGNGMLVQQSDSCIMIDCGFSLKETEARLQRLGLDPFQIDALLITHEHQDHASGSMRLCCKYQIPLLMTYGTMKMLETQLSSVIESGLLNIIDSHSMFEIADLAIQPYPVPHDAREPVQFTIHNGNHKLGILTDTGCSTPHIEQSLGNCDAIILECNHDLQMLFNGPYPASLKKRVSSRLGHLDNLTSAAILNKVKHEKIRHVVAAHISAQNNTAQLAKSALSQVMGCHDNDILLADQMTGLDWLTI